MTPNANVLLIQHISYKNPIEHVSSTLRLRAFRFPINNRQLALTQNNKMTKGKATSSGWLRDTCVFIQKGELSDRCNCCQDPFSFWNGRKNCAFCGCIVHAKCMMTVKTKTRKAKMCNTCSKYKDSYSRMLREG